MTTAAAVLSLGVITACGAPAEEDPMLEDPAVEDPAMEEAPVEEAPMDEPITDEPALDDEEFDTEEEIDVDVEGEETGDEFAEEEEEATN